MTFISGITYTVLFIFPFTYLFFFLSSKKLFIIKCCDCFSCNMFSVFFLFSFLLTRKSYWNHLQIFTKIRIYLCYMCVLYMFYRWMFHIFFLLQEIGNYSTLLFGTQCVRMYIVNNKQMTYKYKLEERNCFFFIFYFTMSSFFYIVYSVFPYAIEFVKMYTLWMYSFVNVWWNEIYCFKLSANILIQYILIRSEIK